jgi:DNA-binding transcriptional ArsR family regulator
MEALAALADGTRREIVELLARGEQPAGAIAERFTVSRPAVSRHLRVLREAGLVHVQARGTQRVYALSPDPFDDLDAWLSGVRRFWDQRLDALGTEVTRGRPARTDEESERA